MHRKYYINKSVSILFLAVKQCKDNPSKSKYCDNNKDYGGCNGSYKDWFAKNCPKTCHICTKPEPATTEAPKPATTEPPKQCNDVAGMSKYCDNNAEYGGCDGKHVEWFTVNCPNTCKKCP